MTQDIIREAIECVEENSYKRSDGKWLEQLVVEVASHVQEWDLERCWLWSEWPDQQQELPKSTGTDVGIDVVAIRRTDSKHIAIQCKSRQLDNVEQGADISKREVDSFAAASSDPDFWAERWIITNGGNSLSKNALAVIPDFHPIKLINIRQDLQQQQASFPEPAEACPHCAPNPQNEERRQSKNCMQSEAVSESVRILREHERSESGGLCLLGRRAEKSFCLAARGKHGYHSASWRN